jgi:hypothetical protein
METCIKKMIWKPVFKIIIPRIPEFVAFEDFQIREEDTNGFVFTRSEFTMGAWSNIQAILFTTKF